MGRVKLQRLVSVELLAVAWAESSCNVLSQWSRSPWHGPTRIQNASLEGAPDADPVQRGGGRRSPPNFNLKEVCEPSLELRQGGAVLPLQGERGIGEPQGRKAELRAVGRRLGAAMTQSTCLYYCHGNEASKCVCS